MKKNLMLRREEEKVVIGYDRNYHIFPEKLLLVEDAIIKEFEMTRDLLRAETRMSAVTLARQMVWYIGRDALGLTSTRLARLYKRDHTTILYGCEMIEKKGLVGRTYQIVAKHNPKLSATWG